MCLNKKQKPWVASRFCLKAVSLTVNPCKTHRNHPFRMRPATAAPWSLESALSMAWLKLEEVAICSESDGRNPAPLDRCFPYVPIILRGFNVFQPSKVVAGFLKSIECVLYKCLVLQLLSCFGCISVDNYTTKTLIQQCTKNTRSGNLTGDPRSYISKVIWIM